MSDLAGFRRFRPFPSRFWLVLCRRIPVGCFRTILVIFQSVSSRTFLEPIGTDRNSPVLSGQESGGKETARKEVIPAGSGDGWMTWATYIRRCISLTSSPFPSVRGWSRVEPCGSPLPMRYLVQFSVSDLDDLTRISSRLMSSLSLSVSIVLVRDVFSSSPRIYSGIRDRWRREIKAIERTPVSSLFSSNTIPSPPFPSLPFFSLDPR